MTPELKERIETEAHAHVQTLHPSDYYGSEAPAFIAGATAWAECAEKLREALEEIASGKVLPHLIAQQVLEQYKKETA